MEFNKRSLTALVALAILFAGCVTHQQEKFEAPLFNDLGGYSIHVTTGSDDARKFFSQGVIMANAFNHVEAARSFKEAVRLDSTCAMAYWGIAYVLGPNYNTSGNLGEQAEIREAVEKAIVNGKNASEWEKALIDAIAIKFPGDSAIADAVGYAEAMQDVYSTFPENDFIATLFAESLMNLHAWDLYERKGGSPRPWTSEIVSVLEKAIKINVNNPLANHLYIHAVEAAPDVEKGLPSAERLKTLVPAAGHLVHMPSHIYINTGHYHEGSVANEEAVRRDSIYIAECNAEGVYPQIYYPHNYHFLAATATLEGRGARAIEASFKMSEIIDRNYLRRPGFETTQHYITIPYNVLVKFAQWEKILALPSPEQSLHYPKAIWHYARGMAFANTGRIDESKSELDSVIMLLEKDDVQKMMIWEINKTADVASIAANVLRAEIAAKSGNLNDAVEFLRQAVEQEDALNYNEPPDWFFSVRHKLGDVYMEMKEYARAESVYREDLATFPKNGFALNGLYHSLIAQQRNEEAGEIKLDFDEAWKLADSPLKYASIDQELRTDLAIRISESTPNDLLYIAGISCGTGAK